MVKWPDPGLGRCEIRDQPSSTTSAWRICRLGQPLLSVATASTCGDQRNWSIGVTWSTR